MPLHATFCERWHESSKLQSSQSIDLGKSIVLIIIVSISSSIRAARRCSRYNFRPSSYFFIHNLLNLLPETEKEREKQNLRHASNCDWNSQCTVPNIQCANRIRAASACTASCRNPNAICPRYACDSRPRAYTRAAVSGRVPGPTVAPTQSQSAACQRATDTCRSSATNATVCTSASRSSDSARRRMRPARQCSAWVFGRSRGSRHRWSPGRYKKKSGWWAWNRGLSVVCWNTNGWVD